MKKLLEKKENFLKEKQFDFDLIYFLMYNVIKIQMMWSNES